MPLNIIDTHAHLDMPQFNSDREAVISRAANVGVSAIVTNGTDLESSRQAIRLAEQFPGVYATVGFHPQDARKMIPGDIGILTRLAKHPKVVAIGEIGLDYYRENTHRNIQKQVLEQELDLALRLDLPVVIHARHAEQDMLGILTQWVCSFNTNRENIGTIHCFNGDLAAAQQYLKLGFYIGLDAYIGYPSSKMSEVIKNIPVNRLLIETDCPFLPPQSHRGKRNEPAYLPETLTALADIRGDSADNLARQTTENALRLFSRLK